MRQSGVQMVNDMDAQRNRNEDSNGLRIKDIAAKAGVSPTTVSNVIHGNKKKVSENTVKKVRRILDETGYIPSVGASVSYTHLTLPTTERV